LGFVPSEAAYHPADGDAQQQQGHWRDDGDKPHLWGVIPCPLLVVDGVEDGVADVRFDLVARSRLFLPYCVIHCLYKLITRHGGIEGKLLTGGASDAPLRAMP